MKIIDLSQTFENNMPQFPGTPSMNIEQVTTIEQAGFQLTDFHSVVHVGTHCDAPAHFIPGGTTIDKISLDYYVGEAVIVDVPVSADRAIAKDILQNVHIKEGDIVLLRSNTSQNWGNDSYVHEALYLSEELANELVRLKVKAVGLDFISPDEVTTETSPIHHILLGNHIVLIENLKNLDQIDTERVFFSAAPLKIKDSDGAFTRAYAIIFDN